MAVIFFIYVKRKFEAAPAIIFRYSSGVSSGPLCPMVIRKCDRNVNLAWREPFGDLYVCGTVAGTLQTTLLIRK